jgi:hypothetical protein
MKAKLTKSDPMFFENQALMFKEFLARTDTNYNENLKKPDIDLSDHILDLNSRNLVETKDW